MGKRVLYSNDNPILHYPKVYMTHLSLHWLNKLFTNAVDYDLKENFEEQQTNCIQQDEGKQVSIYNENKIHWLFRSILNGTQKDV